jgi:hypothetical protein
MKSPPSRSDSISLDFLDLTETATYSHGQWPKIASTLIDSRHESGCKVLRITQSRPALLEKFENRPLGPSDNFPTFLSALHKAWPHLHVAGDRV